LWQGVETALKEVGFKQSWFYPSEETTIGADAITSDWTSEAATVEKCIRTLREWHDLCCYDGSVHDQGSATSCDTSYFPYIEWGTSSVTDRYCYAVQVDPKDVIRNIIRSRTSPAIHTRKRTTPKRPLDIRERRARETLHRLIGERNFRRFLRNGFISITAKSGLVYQIYPGHGITAVWKDGKMIERLCVILKGDFPPTDSILMRYLMILSSEDEFRSLAVKHHVGGSGAFPFTITIDSQEPPEPRPLLDMFNELKKQAA